jgi:hypothetical protein
MTGGQHVSWPSVQFSVIGEAWRLYKRQWFVWSLAMLIVMIGFSVVNGTCLAILDGGRPRHHGGFRMSLPLGEGLRYLIYCTSTGFFLGGMIRMASRQVQGQVPRIEDLFTVTDVWFDLLFCSFLFGLASCIGSMFCVIPGLIVSGLFMLGIPLVVEGRMPATGALMLSWNALKSQWLIATVFHLVLIVVACSGSLLCGIGIFMTGPLYSLSLAILYREFFPATATTAWKKHAEPFPEV